MLFRGFPTVFPQAGLRLRWLLILLGMVLFIWLSVEDQRSEPVSLLGVGAAGGAVLSWASRQWGGQPLQRVAWRWLLPLLGFLWGGAAALATALLMFFKTALHSHAFPDFPLPMILATLERLPIWALAGALLGLGLYALGRALYPEQ